ncbi:MAG: IS630 family transposase [Luteolibacter sp.]
MLTGPVDQAELQKRRMKAVRLFEKNIAPAEVARRLGVHRQSAGRWRKQWLAEGKDALASKGRLGRKRDLTPEQEQQLAALIEAGAVAAGFPNEAWTLPRLAKLVRERFGVDHHPSHLSRVLSAMGFSCQRPARRAIERDEEKIRHWKRYQWPSLKKKPGAKDV